MADFDLPMLGTFAVVTVFAVGYGVRAVFPPLRRILGVLHGIDFQIGWPRSVMALLVLVGVYVTNNADLIDELEQPDDLLGPAIANAIDGDTLFMLGVEVELFGIDAVEQDQDCQDATGADYPCGRAATAALQALVQRNDVVCAPLFSTGARRVVAICEIVTDDAPAPRTQDELFTGYRPNNLSRLLVEQGHALAVGLAQDVLMQEQLQAQTLRVGIWQGSFEPPSAWRLRR